MAEVCSGSVATCPSDKKKTGVCRSSAGPCDAAESCDGTHNDCPADAFQPSTATCRASAGACDGAELCTGSSAACPPDAKRTGICRMVAGPCDVEERCDGVNNACPTDAFKPTTTVCRASVGVCDAPDLCTGASAACPALPSSRYRYGPRCVMRIRGPWAGAAGVLAGLLLALGCNDKSSSVATTADGPKEAAAAGPPVFEDVTAASGVKHTYRNGEDTANQMSRSSSRHREIEHLSGEHKRGSQTEHGDAPRFQGGPHLA